MLPEIALLATLTNGIVYAPGTLPPAFEEADMWAYTIAQERQLPPAKYDHPYNGVVYLYQADNQADMRIKCNRGDLFPSIPIFGCSWAASGDRPCVIVVGDMPTITKWGWTRNIVIRHEIGHCNGWPGTHEGAR